MRDASPLSHPQSKTERWAARLTTPAGFAAGTILAYALLLLPILLRHHGDLSVFIVAGDRFVDATRTASRILLHPHSAGYDGQFYYALALDPFTTSPIADGIRFDHPAWRGQRILYPLLAHLLALGSAIRTPAALVGVNLAALAAIAAIARRALPIIPSLAIVLWPGFLTALTHDTTEILACALLLAALLAYRTGNLLLFASLGALAALTRETAILMLGGILLASLTQLARPRTPPASAPVKTACAAAAAMVPFLLWHLWLAHLWHGVPDALPAHNIDLPFFGIAGRIAASLAGLLAGHGVSARMRWLDAYALATALTLLGFSIATATAAWRLSRHSARDAAICIGWACMLALMSLLSASGPWVEPTATFRAFSECWVVGWLILAAAPSRPATLALPVIVPLALMNWSLCILQLQGGVLTLGAG